MYLVVLGRQPKIGIAELEAVFGADGLEIVSETVCLVKTETFNIGRLGGAKKAGKVVSDGARVDCDIIYDILKEHISGLSGKVTLGFSSYTRKVGVRQLEQVGRKLKSKMKNRDGSLRLIQNDAPELNTAVSHHNKLGLSTNKIEVLLAERNGKMIVALSTGAQNISSYAARDQKRPARDAFVGMLPPKLAQTITNLASGSEATDGKVLLDPFCGTGVLLQEAVLMGYKAYGTDLSEKMIEYSRTNMEWLKRKYKDIEYELAVGDAMKTRWEKDIDVVACETYLGQPFSAVPSPKKLGEVQRNCKHIVTAFLKNIHGQIKTGTVLCLAVPAWRRSDGGFSRLKLLDSIEAMGYNVREFKHVRQTDMLYARENQVVGRELIVLRRS